MAKKFKSLKRKKRRKSVYVLMIGIISFAVCLSYFSSLLQKEEVLDFLIESTIYQKSNNYHVKKETSIFDFLLDYTIGQKDFLEEEDSFYDGTKSLQEYIPDPNPEENKSNPSIYLYSTHQGEEYKGDTLSIHDITPTVMLASYKLREELNKKGLNTIVEVNPISEVLKINNWNYASSYKASRLMMESAKEKNPTLKYYFDIHRDAISYENSITTYNGKTYAKVLFVIGIDYDGYEKNLILAKKLDAKLKEKVPLLSRGVIKKGGKGVNGIYNQDFSSNTLLFEIGGQYNKIGEVNNTLLVLSEALKEIIG